MSISLKKRRSGDEIDGGNINNGQYKAFKKESVKSASIKSSSIKSASVKAAKSGGGLKISIKNHTEKNKSGEYVDFDCGSITESFGEKLLGTMSGIFKALGENSRLKIVLALMEREMCVYHISEATGQKQSLTSHQLRLLKYNNIIKSRREGQLMIYSLADEHIKNIINMTIKHLNC